MNDALTAKENASFMLLNTKVISLLIETRSKGPYGEWKPDKEELIESLQEAILDLQQAINNLESHTVTKKCADLVVFAMKVNDLYGQILPVNKT